MMPLIYCFRRTNRFAACRFAAVFLAAIVVLLSGAARGEEQVLFDFDSRSLSDDWSALQQIKVAREAVPDPSAEAGVVPSGRGARVETGGSGGLLAKSGKVPGDWRGFESVSFWVYRSPKEVERRPTSTIEIQIYESDGKARFWRKVELGHTGWKRISEPLRWFRCRDQRVPRWDRVDRFGIWFRDAAEITVDAIAVSCGTTEVASELTTADLVSTAFPDADPKEIRVLDNDLLRVVTNAAELDLQKLGDHLKLAADCVRRDVPFIDKPAAPATLIVFATRPEFQKFPARVAKQQNASAPLATSAGFTTHGIGTSYWDERFGTLRPVYVHEFVHSLVHHGALFTNTGEWFHEGLATYFQVQAHPQEGLSRIVINGIEKEALHLPLPQLLNGRPISTTRYWQALTVIELLLTDEAYRQQWPELIAAFQQSGSTDVGPHLGPVLKTNWKEFEERWKKHCRRVYGPKS